MPNRLQPLNLTSFIGGLNLRRNQFQLAEDESPDMLNVDIDPRGGFFTRRGWQRWNDDDVTDLSVPWQPRNAAVHYTSTGQQYIYVVNSDGHVYVADEGTNFVDLGAIGGPTPDNVDATAWGDDAYLVFGQGADTFRRNSLTGVITTLTDDTFSEVDSPVLDTLPKASNMESHIGYLFIANTDEGDGQHPNRIRWSHPGQPDAWRIDDFLDIELGGSKITALLSFQDHLLIFKDNSVWALYGYDDDSWQTVRLSSTLGCPGANGATKSQTTVFFYTSTGRGGIHSWDGEGFQYISEKLQTAFEELINVNDVFVSWAGRRLWVSVPWRRDVGSTAEPSTLFVFDPDVGEGAWTMYRSDYGAVATVLDSGDSSTKNPIATFWSTEAACLIMLDFISEAYDDIYNPNVLGVTPPTEPPDDMGYLVTSDDFEIRITGTWPPGQPFEAYYRTRWLHAGWPDRKKSWRRPTFICRHVPRETQIIVESYRDYDETTIHRSRILTLGVAGSAFWSEDGFDSEDVEGFDWSPLGEDAPSGRGANWDIERTGSLLIRGGSMGLARAVQMRVATSTASPGQRWGVDGIVAKIVMRRFR